MRHDGSKTVMDDELIGARRYYDRLHMDASRYVMGWCEHDTARGAHRPSERLDPNAESEAKLLWNRSARNTFIRGIFRN